jgi:hypothetical protein
MPSSCVVDAKKWVSILLAVRCIASDAAEVNIDTGRTIDGGRIMNTLYFRNQLLLSIDDAYKLYKPTEFESPTRSTIPLLSWLKHESTAVNEVLRTL